MSQGNVDKSNNRCSLIRGAGDGKANIESFVTTMRSGSNPGAFTHMGTTMDATIPTDAKGREIYDPEVLYDGSNYTIKICGYEVKGMDTIDDALKSYGGYGYIGVTFHSAEKHGTASATILLEGTSKENAEGPTGTNSALPEENHFGHGDPVDPATVPAGRPALLWDATKSSFRDEPRTVEMPLSVNADNGYHATSHGRNPYFLGYIRQNLTYMGQDFPVFAMLLKDYSGTDGALYYCAGNVLGPSQAYLQGWSAEDTSTRTYGEGSEYKLVIVNLAGKWSGCIQALRPVFGVDATGEE